MTEISDRHENAGSIRQSASAFAPEQELAFFGAPPLLKGEDPNKYNQLLATISSTVTPADIFEGVFVRTIVNLIWETNRYRRLIANMIKAAEPEALERLLRPLLYGSDTALIFDGDDPDCPLITKAQALAKQYTLQKKDAVEEVDALFARAGLDWEAVKAAAFSFHLREIEVLNRMVAGAEARMKTTLREIDRHRKGFGQQLRRAIEELDDPATPLGEAPEERKRAA
jgi:hypothetical protein